MEATRMLGRSVRSNRKQTELKQTKRRSRAGLPLPFCSSIHRGFSAYSSSSLRPVATRTGFVPLVHPNGKGKAAPLHAYTHTRTRVSRPDSRCIPSPRFAPYRLLSVSRVLSLLSGSTSRRGEVVGQLALGAVSKVCFASGHLSLIDVSLGVDTREWACCSLLRAAFVCLHVHTSVSPCFCLLQKFLSG